MSFFFFFFRYVPAAPGTATLYWSPMGLLFYFIIKIWYNIMGRYRLLRAATAWISGPQSENYKTEALYERKVGDNQIYLGRLLWMMSYSSSGKTWPWSLLQLAMGMVFWIALCKKFREFAVWFAMEHFQLRKPRDKARRESRLATCVGGRPLGCVAL